MTVHRHLPPSARDAAVARASGQLLSRVARRDHPLTVRVIDADHDQPIDLPGGAVTMLMDILEAMAARPGVTLLPENAELTTVEAAEILNVSRPFVIKLMDEGRIPCRKVGKHRRARLEDVVAFKEADDRKRQSVLDRLAAEAQEQGMGYPKR